MSPFAPSTHQQRFFDWLKTGRGSAILIAVAGSGKTTTVFKALPLIPERESVLVLSFNSINTREAKERLEKLTVEYDARHFEPRTFRKVRCSTFHSLGFGSVCKFLNLRPDQITTDGGKLGNLFRAGHGENDIEMYGAFVTKLVSLAKGEGIGAIVPDTADRWWGLVNHHDLSLESEFADEETGIELARELLRSSNEVARQGSIDFDDQIYLPLLWRLRLWQNDWVFVDEAQDTNPARRALVKLALRPGGRLVAVGDPFQAIYGFTGASNDALELIKQEFRAVELPLTVSYRCPKAVGPLVRGIVPYFETAPNAIEGEVKTLPVAEALKLLSDRDVVLCRNTAPLVELAYQMIAEGRGCTILGKEIGEGLVKLIKQMKAAGLERLLEKIGEFEAREVAKHMAKGEEGRAEAVTDRVACIVTVANRLPETQRTIPALIAKLGSMFSDTNGVLTLSTVHKAKGREWLNVAIYRPELMPSKWARQEHQYKQELNLQVVAWTRAKETLIFMTEDAQ